MHQRTRRIGLIGLMASCLLAASCGGSSDEELEPIDTIEPSSTDADAGTATSDREDAGDTTTTEASTSSSATETLVVGEKPDLEIPTEWESDLDEVFGRYLLYWEAWYIAAGPPEADVDYPPLAELTTEDALEGLKPDFETYRARNAMVTFEEDSITQHVPRLTGPGVLTKEEGREVTIQDCSVDDYSFETPDGEVLFEAFEPILLNVLMKVVDNEWRVAGVRIADPGSDGEAECREFFETLS